MAMVEYLLSVDPSLALERGQQGKLPIHMICEYGCSSKVVSRLAGLMNGATVTMKDGDGNVPLRLALMVNQHDKKRLNMIRALIKGNPSCVKLADGFRHSHGKNVRCSLLTEYCCLYQNPEQKILHEMLRSCPNEVFTLPIKAKGQECCRAHLSDFLSYSREIIEKIYLGEFRLSNPIIFHWIPYQVREIIPFMLMCVHRKKCNNIFSSLPEDVTMRILCQLAQIHISGLAHVSRTEVKARLVQQQRKGKEETVSIASQSIWASKQPEISRMLHAEKMKKTKAKALESSFKTVSAQELLQQNMKEQYSEPFEPDDHTTEDWYGYASDASDGGSTSDDNGTTSSGVLEAISLSSFSSSSDSSIPMEGLE